MTIDFTIRLTETPRFFYNLNKLLNKTNYEIIISKPMWF